MSFLKFLQEKLLYIILMLLVTSFTTASIWILNPVGGATLAIFLGVLYLLGTCIPILVEYITKYNFYGNLVKIYDALDNKNFVSELISLPTFKEGIILYEVIKGCNKSMLEEINKYKYMQEEYREYIELWVHEIKTPISSSRLIAQNNPSEVMSSVNEELEKIEDFVEQVLFYSRSNNVEKDYLIKELNLEKLCFTAIRKNSKLLIHNNINIVTENLNHMIYTDTKWLEYILNQIIQNAIKYMDKPNAQIKVSAYKLENSVILSIEDNGAGILESELTRIFEKGFTGTNGRTNERSTGMGLYICKKLCNKLGLSIETSSSFGEGTKFLINFPKSSMMDIR